MSDLDTWMADPAPDDRTCPPVPAAPDGADGFEALAGEDLCRDLAARYAAGATIAGLAKKHGVAVHTMRAALVLGGATIRPPVARRPRRADPVSAAVVAAAVKASRTVQW